MHNHARSELGLLHITREFSLEEYVADLSYIVKVHSVFGATTTNSFKRVSLNNRMHVIPELKTLLWTCGLYRTPRCIRLARNISFLSEIRARFAMCPLPLTFWSLWTMLVSYLSSGLRADRERLEVKIPHH
jgi:hypothetical protein